MACDGTKKGKHMKGFKVIQKQTNLLGEKNLQPKMSKKNVNSPLGTQAHFAWTLRPSALGSHLRDLRKLSIYSIMSHLPQM